MSKQRERPDEYEVKVKPYLDDIRDYVAHGVSEKQLCAFYRIGRTAWATYKKAYPELNETLLRAREVCKTFLTNRAFEIAVGYEYEETTRVEYYDMEKQEDGTVKKVVTGGKTTTVKKYAKADAGMMQFLLLNRYPEEYYRDPQIYELRRKLVELREQDAGGGIGGLNGV